MTETTEDVSRLPGPLSQLGLAVILATLAADQLSKAVATSTLPYNEPIDVLPILALYLTHNTGIAFSLLDGIGSIGLTIATLLITALVLAFWLRSREGGPLAGAGFALIVGGALGNLADRLMRGHVVDFLLLHFGDRTLFVFNVADAALTLGPAMLIVAYMFDGRARRPH